jgi:membrane protein DedA with SNARE-associated domain
MGIPVPGETALIAAGLYAGSTHRLSVAGIVAAAAAGAIVGDNIGYGIGRWGGFRLLRRYGHYVRLDERQLKVGRYLFDRHGGKVVFFGRFVSILRTYAAFLAGTNHMRWRRFVLANAGGGILWATFWGVAAYAFGSALQRLQTPVDIVVGVVAGVGLLTGIAVLRRKGAELTAKAEEAYPGPLTERVRQSPHRGE